MEKNGNEETKNNDTALNVAQKTRGTAPAGRAWDPVCGAFAGGPCLCGRRLGVENAASGAVWPVWLRQFCVGCSGVLPGRAVHAGRGPAAPHLQAGAGARVCKRHGDRVFRHPFMRRLPFFLHWLDTKDIYYFDPFAPERRPEPTAPEKEDVLQNG